MQDGCPRVGVGGEEEGGKVLRARGEDHSMCRERCQFVVFRVRLFDAVGVDGLCQRENGHVGIWNIDHLGCPSFTLSLSTIRTVTFIFIAKDELDVRVQLAAPHKSQIRTQLVELLLRRGFRI